ncbi:MAG: imidazole glycerol phosphate synthase cyclase subunit [Sphaerochaetaceae bacterium]|jgi:cyclase
MNTDYKRIIACLDIENGKVVKGINFENIREVGNVVDLAASYYSKGVDQVALLNISATEANKGGFAVLVKEAAAVKKGDLIAGGGINNLDDAYRLLSNGADKITINSMAVKKPSLIDSIAKEFGQDVLVCAIDVITNPDIEGGWEVVISGGREATAKDAFSWAKEVALRGASGILLTSKDHDGTKQGFAIDLLKKMKNSVDIPIIASGGAGNMDHFLTLFKEEAADGALGASIFHFNLVEIDKLKIYLKKNGISVNL